MTGAFLRILRDSEWQNIEIDQLTDEELDLIEREQPNRGWSWAKFLARWIRENVRDPGSESS